MPNAEHITITTDQVERLARLADQADNYWHAAMLRVPDALHRQQLMEGLQRIARTLKALHHELTNENPWEVFPCAHCQWTRTDEEEPTP
jgi:hypothetical protein